MIAYKDRRTPLLAKILVGITVGYILSPIDLIPDFIPVLGLLDDIIIVPLLITASLKLIPRVVLHEARETAKLSPKHRASKNWIFGTIIMAIWILLLLLLYRRFNYLWK